MLARAIAALLLLASSSPANALDACFAGSVGRWHGPVINGPGLQQMDSEFRTDPDGRLVGRYRVYDATPFNGRLDEFRQTGPCEAEFTWHDRYGTGIVRIRFEPELGRFRGYWGSETANPGLIFNGYRVGPPAVS